MKEVDVEPLDRWGFECPDCKEWNEIDDDPNYQESVFCEKCGEEFKPNAIG